MKDVLRDPSAGDAPCGPHKVSVDDFNQFMVGKKCLVTVKEGRVQACGLERDVFFKSGHSFWRCGGDEDPPFAKLRLPYYFAYNTLRGGKRKKGDQIPRTNSFGEPLPQILVLVALQTRKFSDWVKAIQLWESVRSELLGASSDASAKGLELLKDRAHVLMPEPPALLGFSGNEEHNVTRMENWAAQWTLTMTRSEGLDHLCVWERAARQALERLTLVNEGLHFADHLADLEKGEVSEMSCLLRAVKRATLVCGGVPHLGRVTSILRGIDRPRISPDRARSIYKTVGFQWLPSEAHWKRDWAPIAETKNWI